MGPIRDPQPARASKRGINSPAPQKRRPFQHRLPYPSHVDGNDTRLRVMRRYSALDLPLPPSPPPPWLAAGAVVGCWIPLAHTLPYPLPNACSVVPACAGSMTRVTLAKFFVGAFLLFFSTSRVS
ncbi:uncharacterized protein SCHCODRAFT_02614530 [Schizophyllum commune H4-8]|uniref:uncharacterized protein n=1 Tax=Schizophyllum commune (strain H4-8 / FGSC 9210) TaxID=578458 RepID=UPI00215EAD83|nr:uncharacterized protein SCHCODRAFT_02614530 [Schizophyllum commune H4-8]KAI5896311.1 hypothetical protein SCHCODRAFT_02614530 [Schizophyllum commune H4-8]